MRLLALLALPFAAITAVLSPPPSVSLSAVAPGDTAKVVATWPVAVDSRGAADAYVVKWSWPNPTMQTTTRTLSRTTDTLMLQLPTWPNSISVRVTVFSKRRTLTSADSVTTLRWFKRDEGLPPAPASVALDTAATP